MVSPVKDACNSAFNLIDKGLNHSNFYGKFISWGILFGSLACLSYKIYSMALKNNSLFFEKFSFFPPKNDEKKETKVKKIPKPPKENTTSTKTISKSEKMEKIVEKVKM